FMGTPHLCVPVLKRIAEDGHEILAVYTQPDRTSGRGRTKAISPLKEYSLSKNYQVLQPENFRDNSSEINTLKNFDADIAVVAAYGILLPPDVLNAFRHGCINLHPSLLPKYRGASPVSSAILAGDEYTGVTIIQLDSGLDSGPILSQEKIKLK
ncbi:MAG: methionyl-tRNA formyltransferase, partial [Chloroflexota bacterium]|nr:methionyl-tRNA formyltransferase [Chloroflexota bacterium]